MKILPMYGGTEWAADPCAVLVDQSYYDEYQREANASLQGIPEDRQGVRITQAAVSRELAKVYAIHQMTRNFSNNVKKQGTAKRAYGLCEVEELLDLIYGCTRDQKVVKAEDMLKELQ